jgi:hypothetical protein
MPWQLPETTGSTQANFPISRCNSVVALSLNGELIRKVRNNTRDARKEQVDRGHVYDPWSPWHVLNIQCYPDHAHGMDIHDSTKHYVNGPEALLVTLFSEFRDAHKRLKNIYIQISKLVTPSVGRNFLSPRGAVKRHQIIDSRSEKQQSYEPTHVSC